MAMLTYHMVLHEVVKPLLHSASLVFELDQLRARLVQLTCQELVDVC